METEALIKAVRVEQARMEALRNALIVHAAAQEYVEMRCNELLYLTRDAITLILACPVGTPLPAAWIQQRDTLMQRITRFIDTDTGREHSAGEESNALTSHPRQ